MTTPPPWEVISGVILVPVDLPERCKAGMTNPVRLPATAPAITSVGKCMPDLTDSQAEYPAMPRVAVQIQGFSLDSGKRSENTCEKKVAWKNRVLAFPEKKDSLFPPR